MSRNIVNVSGKCYPRRAEPVADSISRIFPFPSGQLGSQAAIASETPTARPSGNDQQMYDLELGGLLDVRRAGH